MKNFKLLALLATSAMISVTALAGQHGDGEGGDAPVGEFAPPSIIFHKLDSKTGAILSEDYPVLLESASDDGGETKRELVLTDYPTDLNMFSPEDPKKIFHITQRDCFFLYNATHFGTVCAARVKENNLVYNILWGANGYHASAALSSDEFSAQLSKQAMIIADRLNLYVAASSVMLNENLPQDLTLKKIHAMREQFARATNKLSDSLGNTQFGWMRLKSAYPAEFAPLQKVDWTTVFLAKSLSARLGLKTPMDDRDIDFVESATKINEILELVEKISVYEPAQTQQWNPLQAKIVSDPLWPLAKDIGLTLNANGTDYYFNCTAIPNCPAAYNELAVVVMQILSNTNTKTPVGPRQ
jgi:hypothetical protein